MSVEPTSAGDDRAVPSPLWVDAAQLDARLARLRGEISDSNVGLFGPESLMWRIGRCHLATGLGSGRALLLQLAHPWVAHGVAHHSRTREDPIGRARRTFTHVLSMTLGSIDQAFAAATRVYGIHTHIRGALDVSAGGFHRGEPYGANEAHALMWVHATLWDTAVRMYEKIVAPLSEDEKERFYSETKRFALLFGIPESLLPSDWPAFVAYNERMWVSAELAVSPAALEIARFLFKPLAPGLGGVTDAMRFVTAATLPPSLARDFELPHDDACQSRAERIIRRVAHLHKILPDRLRYSPTYFEALARIEGRRSDLFTRAATRLMLGRWRLVS